MKFAKVLWVVVGLFLLFGVPYLLGQILMVKALICAISVISGLALIGYAVLRDVL